MSNIEMKIMFIQLTTAGLDRIPMGLHGFNCHYVFVVSQANITLANILTHFPPANMDFMWISNIDVHGVINPQYLITKPVYLLDDTLVSLNKTPLGDRYLTRHSMFFENFRINAYGLDLKQYAMQTHSKYIIKLPIWK